MAAGTGYIRVRRAEEKSAPLPFVGAEPIKLETSLPEALESGLRQTLADRGIEHESVSFGFVPALRFDVAADGQVWHVQYNPIQGTLSTAEPVSVRRFLLLLHLAHTYPSDLGARWLWAIVVDVMFLPMLFWAASGVLMWWQIKSVRRWGAVTLGASAVVATLLIFSMHRLIAW